MATISRAIQSREAGFTLSHSSRFPGAVAERWVHQFFGDLLSQHRPGRWPLAEQLKSSGALTPQQRQSIDALKANSAPGLIYAYGEPDRIVVASNTGFMGFDLGTLLTMGDNGPFMPQMFLGGTMNRPTQPQHSEYDGTTRSSSGER